MKLLRHCPKGQEMPGLLDAQGHVRDLSRLLDDITPRTLPPAALQVLRALDAAQLPLVHGQPCLGVPWNGCGKFFAIGLNYHEHTRDAGMSAPAEPVMFTKWTSCINGPDDHIICPRKDSKVDWEVELGIVIGSRAQNVNEAQALQHVAGYVLVNDISERAFQIERSGGLWSKGKGLDTKKGALQCALRFSSRPPGTQP